MRRVTLYTLFVSSLLLGAIASAQPVSEVPRSASHFPLGSPPRTAAFPLQHSCYVSPPESSPPSVAYVANISSLAHWQRELATRVNVTRLLGLLHILTGFDSRHPFNIDGNASLDWVTSSLTQIGVSYTEDWFIIPKRVWNGIDYVYQTYWTRNLYVTPWDVNPAAPTLLITCHVDSARFTLLGLASSNAPGANDDASGVVTLLETICVLTQHSGIYQNWNVLFAFLSGEEGNGSLSLWGSLQLLEHGLPTLGINKSTSIALNLDEIAYKGMFLPTNLAIYRYPNEGVQPLLSNLTAASTNLGFSLLDTEKPRANTLEEVQKSQAWSISEWMFHTNSIPSLTLSTDQYPDPYKHTFHDTEIQCSTINLLNITRLIIATILALTYHLPPTPPNYLAQWYPTLSPSNNITLTDYLDPSLHQYQTLVLDPGFTIIPINALRLVNLSIPILALGKAGCQLLHELTMTSTTSRGTQSLGVEGFKAFHPIIQSPHLLMGEDAQLFRNSPLVYAVAPLTPTLILVGNASWCSLAYFPPTSTQIPIVFLGLNTPQPSNSGHIATNSLSWLLDQTTFGICQGIDQKNPRVGTTPILYVLVYNFINWTGYSNQPVQVNITCKYFPKPQLTHLVTNESGITTTPLFLTNPASHYIHACIEPDLESLFILTPLSLCSTYLQYESSVQQGERLSVFCFINSSLDAPTNINLSLSATLVGYINKTNLLLTPGENLYHLHVQILPNCPSQLHNLTLLISTPDLILHCEHVPLNVQVAFMLTLIEMPQDVIQNTPFQVTVNITNLGSQTRAFEIVGEANFYGSTQTILQPNEIRTISLTVQYIPQTIMDTGIRYVSIALYLETYRIMSVENQIFIAHSTINLIITLIPPIFLISLCVIGIIWMRNGKRAQRNPPTQSTPSSLLIPPGTNSREMKWGSSTDATEHQLNILPPEVHRQITQAMKEFGLNKAETKDRTKNRVVLTWEKNGNELHIKVKGENPELVNRLFHFFSKEMNSKTNEGESPHG